MNLFFVYKGVNPITLESTKLYIDRLSMLNNAKIIGAFPTRQEATDFALELEDGGGVVVERFFSMQNGDDNNLMSYCDVLDNENGGPPVIVIGGVKSVSVPGDELFIEMQGTDEDPIIATTEQLRQAIALAKSAVQPEDLGDLGIDFDFTKLLEKIKAYIDLNTNIIKEQIIGKSNALKHIIITKTDGIKDEITIKADAIKVQIADTADDLVRAIDYRGDVTDGHVTKKADELLEQIAGKTDAIKDFMADKFTEYWEKFMELQEPPPDALIFDNLILAVDSLEGIVG